MKNLIHMDKSNEEPTLQEAFDRFIREKKILKLSEGTISSYEKSFNNFIQLYPADNLCSEITHDTIFDFIEFLQKRNPSIKTISINSYLRDIRTMLYSFMKLGYTERFEIKMIKCEKELKETYSSDELERLLKKPNIKECRFSEYRNWVMVCYLLGTGNRLSTLVNIKIRDIDFENQEIYLRTVKNKKQHIIPLSHTLSKALLEYLKYRQGEPEDYLFCNQYGGQLSKHSVTTSIYRYNHSRGVMKTSVHLFRHTFAKNWILSGGDIFRLKSILGHSSLEIVKEYVNMFGGDLKRDFDKFNPLEHMKEHVSGREAISMRRPS